MISTDPPTRWNADARSRAHTRALLMSLGRDRDWYFVLPIGWNVALALLTFGLVPLATFGSRVDRWRRLEWTQRVELSDWIAGHRAPLIGQRLMAESERVAAPGGGAMLWWVGIIVAAFAGVAVHQSLTSNAAPLEWVWPSSPGMRASLTFAHVAAAFAWTLQSRNARDLARPPDRWLDDVNRWLERGGQRPVTPPAASRRTRWLWSAAPFAWPAAAVTGSPVWMLAIAATLLAWNDTIAATRAVRLQLIARMLEWMDEGGAAVEYDVEALKPEQIAAMIA